VSSEMFASTVLFLLSAMLSPLRVGTKLSGCERGARMAVPRTPLKKYMNVATTYDAAIQTPGKL
jgi:hypothetical protein